jgi:hypothetical protein
MLDEKEKLNAVLAGAETFIIRQVQEALRNAAAIIQGSEKMLDSLKLDWKPKDRDHEPL